MTMKPLLTFPCNCSLLQCISLWREMPSMIAKQFFKIHDLDVIEFFPF